MKLQQLRFLAAVAQNDLNLTAAAAKLHTTQPAVSKQLKLLEEELGVSIFVRNGRAFTKITPAGERVVMYAHRLLREAQNIKGVSQEFKDQGRGALSIGTTHTQARYVLPAVISQFREQYPDVEFHLHQGASEQLAEMAQLDHIDFAIATGSQNLFAKYVLLPCYQWHRRIIVPADHPLARVKRPRLDELADYPLVTYVFSFMGPSSLQETFAAAGLRPKVALTARDSDVIKTYVRLGLGVGIVAEVAEVHVGNQGQVEVDRVTCAVDCGIAVNPNNIVAQVEGSVAFGLGAVLYGAITLKDGRVEQDNFNNYRVLRMSEMPHVQVFIVPSSEAPTGIGEPAVAVIGPAVANAVAAATGNWITRLPMGQLNE